MGCGNYEVVQRRIRKRRIRSIELRVLIFSHGHDNDVTEEA